MYIQVQSEIASANTDDDDDDDEDDDDEQEEEEQVKVLSLINAYGGKGRCGPCSRPAKRGSSRADVVKRTSGSSEVWGGYLGPQGAKQARQFGLVGTR